MINRKLKLDVWRQSPDVTVIASQGEINSRFLDITLADGSSYFNLTGYVAMIYLTKPDGKIIFNNCQIVNAANGLIRVGLTSQMSIVAGLVKDCEIHIVNNTSKARLKIKGICIDIQKSFDIDTAAQSTNEFTSLLEALKKADELLAYVTEFIRQKGIEIDNIVAAKMRDADSQMSTFNANASAAISKVQTDGANTISSINGTFNSNLTDYNNRIDTVVTSGNAAVDKIELDGTNAISAINSTFDSNLINYNNKVNAAVTSANTATQNANEAATEARTTAESTAIAIVNSQKGLANGIASLNASGKLVQTPTATDIGAVPTTRIINGKALSSNITLTVADIGVAAIFLAAYPIGSIYTSTVATNPGTLYGGTWVIWGTGSTPVGINTSDTDFNTAEKTGGAKTHTLTVGEIPSHNHGYLTGWGEWVADKSDTLAVSRHPDTVARYGYNTGGGQAHNNLQPYITCYFWKRTT